MNRNGWLALTFHTLFIIFILAPIVVVCVVAFTPEGFLSYPTHTWSLRWFRAIARYPEFIDAFVNSLWLGLLSSAIAVALSVPAALAIARHEFFGKAALASILLSPLVLPHLVLGAALLQFGASIGLMRNFASLLVGHVVIITPFVLRTVLPLLSREQQALEEASRDLGANAPTTFFLITLPQIRSGLAVGAIFAFITSFINVELSIFNTTASLNTVPVQLFNYVQYSVDPSIAAVSSVTIIAAVVAIVVIDMTIGLDFLSDKG